MKKGKKNMKNTTSILQTIRFRGLLAALAFFICLTFAHNAAAQTLPTLRGDEAVKELKQNGQYDSLMEAVKQTRKENGQTDEPQTEDAVGQSAKLIASDGLANDLFGNNVAVSGDTAIVGARQHDVGGNANQGSAYIYVRNGTVWSQQAQLNATGGLPDDLFGSSVSIDGNTVIVGALFDDVGANINQGSAYIFVRSAGMWTQQQQLLATGGTGDDRFGFSVSIDGETVIVGAAFDNVGANADQGAAYIFTRSAGMWTQQQQLNATDGAAQDRFGISVAISGDTAIVGSYLDDVGANVNQGSAYIFVRSAGVWSQEAQLTATGGLANDQYGISVSIDGDTAVVGAWVDDVGANLNQGSAYVFARSGTTWTQQQQLTATGGAADDRFGQSVAISGDKIIVGAPGSDASVNVPLAPQATDQGAVFIFVNVPLAPTAANVSISGRVTTTNGAGLRNAVVTLTDSAGNTRTARTGSFGYYSFNEVEAGQTYTIAVNSKRFVFASQVVSVSDSITDLDFTAIP